MIEAIEQKTKEMPESNEAVDIDEGAKDSPANGQYQYSRF